MAIKIYNTLTRGKEEFKPLKENNVGIYVCGPTVYDDSHIGHARSAFIFDVVRRYFVYCGYRVKFVKNITDIDDKIIAKAASMGISVKEVAEKYLKKYNDDMKALGVQPPDEAPKATENIKGMISLIRALIEKGYAYESDGDVYFEVKKFKGYGSLSHQDLDQMAAGARVARAEHKRDPLDFALWKRSKEGEPSWDSPWGQGRPGWHIECSVMSAENLGKNFDIHGGGIDLIFPHHENEIAQSEAAYGEKFANYWMHNGLLTIDSRKMAKSLGNFIKITDFIEKHNADTLKLFFLSAHYSHPIDFTAHKIEEAHKARERIIIVLDRLRKFEKGKARPKESGADGFKARFKEAMDDDFNMPAALGVIFDLVAAANKYMDEAEASGSKPAETKFSGKDILELTGVFALELKKEGISPDLKEIIEKKIKARDDARARKDFKAADRIRDELLKDGVILEDSKDGTVWRLKE
ncbi:MAG: cysteine--tRNA ligase [Candidatus Omnitrophota bacterium]